MSVVKDVTINFKRRTSISVPELPLNHFWRRSRVKQKCCVCMTKRVEAATRDAERVEDRPQVVLHHLVA